MVNKSDAGQKSPPMEKLHALVLHQLQEVMQLTNQEGENKSSFQEDKEEADSDIGKRGSWGSWIISSSLI